MDRREENIVQLLFMRIRLLALLALAGDEG